MQQQENMAFRRGLDKAASRKALGLRRLHNMISKLYKAMFAISNVGWLKELKHCCFGRMAEMRQQENEAFRRDLDEAASSKAELADQLSDARAEAASWQHQLAEAKEVQDTLRQRLAHERTAVHTLEQELEVNSMLPGNAVTICTTIMHHAGVGQSLGMMTI